MNVCMERFTNVKDLLRAHIGTRTGGLPIEWVAAETGIGKSLIDKHMRAEGSLPNADHMNAYLRVLPDTFAGAYLAKSGIRHFRVAPEVDFTIVLPTAGRLVEQFGNFMADGILDHQERPIARRLLFSAGATFQNVAVTLQ